MMTRHNLLTHRDPSPQIITFTYSSRTCHCTLCVYKKVTSFLRCFRKLLDISYRDHITNEEVNARIGNTIGPYEDLLKWYGHITQSSGLAKTILQGRVQRGRGRGRQRKRWKDNIKEWTGLEWNIILRKAENCEEWGKLVIKFTVVPQWSARLQDR